MPGGGSLRRASLRFLLVDSCAGRCGGKFPVWSSKKPGLAWLGRVWCVRCVSQASGAHFAAWRVWAGGVGVGFDGDAEQTLVMRAMQLYGGEKGS